MIEKEFQSGIYLQSWQKTGCLTTLSVVPGFYTFTLSSFLLPYILQFIVNLKYLLSIYHIPETVISDEDTLENKTDYHFCPYGAEGQWGDRDIKLIDIQMTI